MINEVIRGMAVRIRAVYPETPVYTERVEQWLEEPCFSIVCQKPELSRFFGGRWQACLSMSVYCFPGKEDGRDKLNERMLKLFHALEEIDCGGERMRGSNMQAVESDGVGVFSVDYRCFLYWEEEAAKQPGIMQEFRLTY